jgi:hypothetical protein
MSHAALSCQARFPIRSDERILSPQETKDFTKACVARLCAGEAFALMRRKSPEDGRPEGHRCFAAIDACALGVANALEKRMNQVRCLPGRFLRFGLCHHVLWYCGAIVGRRHCPVR